MKVLMAFEQECEDTIVSLFAVCNNDPVEEKTRFSEENYLTTITQILAQADPIMKLFFVNSRHSPQHSIWRCSWTEISLSSYSSRNWNSEMVKYAIDVDGYIYKFCGKTGDNSVGSWSNEDISALVVTAVMLSTVSWREIPAFQPQVSGYLIGRGKSF